MSFAGRKLGVLITDGASAAVWGNVRRAFTNEKADLEIVALTIGGVTLDDGTELVAHQMLGGGPSVL